LFTINGGLDLAEPGAVCEVADNPDTPLLWDGFENEDQEGDDVRTSRN
jgi:hypothetical protein